MGDISSSLVGDLDRLLFELKINICPEARSHKLYFLFLFPHLSVFMLNDQSHLYLTDKQDI